MSEEEDVQEDEEKQERFNILDGLTAQEKKDLENYPFPVPDAKHNVHTFLNTVRSTKETTKVGFLTEAELGVPSSTVRNQFEMALISRDICDNPFLEAYYKQEAENTLATSLSREGKLINLAVMQKKVIEDTTKLRKPSSSWFKKKEPAQQSME